MIFRAIWPINDETMPIGALVDEARGDLAALLRRSRAKLTGPGSFAIRDSTTVPGSGRVSRLVLVFTAPACEKPREWPPGGRIVEMPDPIQGAPSGVDPLTVARLLAGEPVEHTKAERWETIRRWTGSDKELERTHGWNVHRERRNMRAAEQVAS